MRKVSLINMRWRTFFALFFRTVTFQPRKVGYGFSKRNLHKWIIILSYPLFHFFLIYYAVVLFNFVHEDIALDQSAKRLAFIGVLFGLSLGLPFFYNYCLRHYLTDFFRKWVLIYGAMPTLAIFNIALKAYFLMHT